LLSYFLSVTRWSCRADASNDFINHYKGIYNALSLLEDDRDKKSAVRHEAASLKINMKKLQIVFMAVFWNRILNQLKKVSEFLQSVELDLVTASNMLNFFS